MGDESERSAVEQGNCDPRNAARKLSSAESVDEEPAKAAVMPTAEELESGDERPTNRARGRI